MPTTGTDPKTTTKKALEALIDSAIAAVSSAAINGFIYATDTTEGLARTSDGEGFFTASDLQLIFWLNDGGDATQLSEIGTPLTQVQVDELQANYATIAAAATLAAEDAAQTALDRVATGEDVVAAGLARDAAEDAVQYDYLVADDAARGTITGMVSGERAYIRSTEHVWLYNGSAWVDQGLSVTSAKADKTYVDGKFAEVDQYSVDITNLYNGSTRDGYYINTSNGGIQAAAGWGVSQFIPVVAGKKYTLNPSSSRQPEIGFYSAASDGAAISFSNATNGEVTVTAPATAKYLVFTAYSPSKPEPAEIMLNEGPVAFPFQDYTGEPDRYIDPARVGTVSETGPFTIEDRLGLAEANYVDVSNQFDISLKRPGFYVSTNGQIRTAAGWACTNFIEVSPGDVFTISAAGGRQPEVGFFSSESDTAHIGANTGGGLTPKTVTIPDGAYFMAFNVASTSYPEPDDIMLSVGHTARPYQAFTGQPDYWLNGERVVTSGPVASGSAKLVLNGAGTAYVESANSGDLIRNEFIPFPVYTLTTYPCRLNIRGTFLNGVSVRDGADDIAPDHALDATIGGNHGYVVGVATVDSHTLAEADQGSIWSLSGGEVVLVEVQDANTLILAHRTINTAPGTGTYTHVSGATNTADFTVTAVTQTQFYRPDANYQISRSVDGEGVTATSGTWLYDDNVTISETCDMLARSEIINWWIANGGVLGGLAPSGDPSYTMTTTYRWDRDGQMTVTRDWLILKATPVSDFMGIQVMRAGNPLSFYVPGALPMTYQGSTIDLSRIEPATVATGGTLYLTAAELQADGEYAHRCLSLWSDKAFAAGFLPVGDAAYDVRRDRVSALAFELFGSSGKQYFRAMDKGDHIAQPGDYYTVTAYRHVCPSSAERTAFYIVRTATTAFVLVDWHDVTKLDRLSIPTDLQGREFTVLDSRNVSLKGGTMPASLPAYVSASEDYGYAVIKVL
tara:strand:- start:5913 stop:8801 length:2889 start_codon:yes stop_codon:yes gene_type:complete